MKNGKLNMQIITSLKPGVDFPGLFVVRKMLCEVGK